MAVERAANAVKHQPKVHDRAGMLHVRVTDTLKARAAATLEELGLTTSEAIRLFLHRVVVEQRLPLELKVPNTDGRRDDGSASDRGPTIAVVFARAGAHAALFK